MQFNRKRPSGLRDDRDRRGPRRGRVLGAPGLADGADGTAPGRGRAGDTEAVDGGATEVTPVTGDGPLKWRVLGTAWTDLDP
jgi:hypothetical protein